MDEFKVTIDRLQLTDEQRTAISTAIQQAVKNQLAEIDTGGEVEIRDLATEGDPSDESVHTMGMWIVAKDAE